MIGKKMISSRPVSLEEAKEILKERTEGKTPTYEQSLTLEYVKKFAKLSKTKEEKLLQELKALEEVSEELAVKIVDILPKDIDSLRLIVPKSAKLKDETIKQILDLVKKAE